MPISTFQSLFSRLEISEGGSDSTIAQRAWEHRPGDDALGKGPTSSIAQRGWEQGPGDPAIGGRGAAPAEVAVFELQRKRPEAGAFLEGSLEGWFWWGSFAGPSAGEGVSVRWDLVAGSPFGHLTYQYSLLANLYFGISNRAASGSPGFQWLSFMTIWAG